MKKLATAILSFGLTFLAVGIIGNILIEGHDPDLIDLYTGLGIGMSMVSLLYLMIGIEQDREYKKAKRKH